MRGIGWNRRYPTGDSRRDERDQALVAMIADRRAELGGIEHCQEMNELADRLVGLVKQRLSKRPQDSGADPEFDAAIKMLLEIDVPLTTLSTPAYRKW